MKKTIVYVITRAMVAVLCVCVFGIRAAEVGILPVQKAPMQSLPEQGSPIQIMPIADDSLDGASDATWVELLAGYRDFKKKYPKNSDLIKFLATTQEPKIMTIGCVDSRADINLLVQAKPGEIFGVRNIANMVPSDAEKGHHATSAALEYGINVLKVQHLILLGHSSCGGIKGLLTGIEGDKHITDWVSQMKDILPKGYKKDKNVSDETVDSYARKALEQSYKNCMKYQFVQDAVNNGQLVLHIWFFDIKKATVFMLDKRSGVWSELSETALDSFLKARGK